MANKSNLYAVWGKVKGSEYKWGSHLLNVYAASANAALKEIRKQSRGRNAVLYGHTITRVKLVKGK